MNNFEIHKVIFELVGLFLILANFKLVNGVKSIVSKNEHSRGKIDKKDQMNLKCLPKALIAFNA